MFSVGIHTSNLEASEKKFHQVYVLDFQAKERFSTLALQERQLYA
jgi:hypothetical protein